MNSWVKRPSPDFPQSSPVPSTVGSNSSLHPQLLWSVAIVPTVPSSPPTWIGWSASWIGWKPHLVGEPTREDGLWGGEGHSHLTSHSANHAGILEVLYCVLIESPEVLNIIQENHIKSIISLLDKHGRNHKVSPSPLTSHPLDSETWPHCPRTLHSPHSPPLLISYLDSSSTPASTPASMLTQGL